MDAVTVMLGVNSTGSIMTMDNPFIKKIKKRLGDLVGPNNTTAERVDCCLQTMQAIDFLAKAVQDLFNRVLPADVMLLQEINYNCAKL